VEIYSQEYFINEYARGGSQRTAGYGKQTTWVNMEKGTKPVLLRALICVIFF